VEFLAPIKEGNPEGQSKTQGTKSKKPGTFSKSINNLIMERRALGIVRKRAYTSQINVERRGS